MTTPVLLVVDDESDIRFLTRVILEDAYEIVEASGGREALEILSTRDDIEIVLLDIRMPEIDGLQVIERLAAMHLLDRLRVVVFSAYSEEDVGNEATRLGAHAKLRKPFTREELIAALAAPPRTEDPRRGEERP